MSDVKISALPTAGALDGTEVLPIVQSAATKKTTTASIAALASGATPGGAAGGDLTGTYPNPTIDVLKVTTGKIAANAVDNSKLAQAPTLTVKGNPTGSTANEQDVTMPTLGPLVSPYLVSPMSTRAVSSVFATFAPNSIFEYTKAGVVKIVALGTGGGYAICDIASGVWTNATVAALAAKTFAGAVYAPTIDRIIALSTAGDLYVLNPNTSPWTVDSTIGTGFTLASLVFLTGHDEVLVNNGSGVFRRYNVAVNPPTLTASYQPVVDSFTALGYDAATDFCYALLQNRGVGGAQGQIYKIPRSSFASSTVGSSTTDQNPAGAANPLNNVPVAGGFVWSATLGGNGGLLWNTTTLAPIRSYGVIGNQPSKFVAHSNGFLYGIGGAGKVSFVKIDPSVNGYRAMRPVDVVSGTSPTAKDVLVGSDGYVYALISHSAGVDIYQLNQ